MDYVGYHGTQTRFPQPTDFSKLKGMDFGPGFYFALDPRDARRYGQYVFRSLVRLENPIRVERSYVDSEALRKIQRGLRVTDADLSFGGSMHPIRYLFEIATTLIDTGTLTRTALRSFLVKLGYDGVFVDAHIATEALGTTVHAPYVSLFSPASVISWDLDEPASGLSRNKRSSKRRARRRTSR